MRYYSTKGIIFVIIIGFMLGITIITLFDKAYVMTAIMLLLSAYLFWMWFDTYCVIEGNDLFYRSALLKGTISIDTITGVIKNKTQYSGIKAALSTKGLIIKYNKWDDIYISPKNAELFISKLKEINSRIEVTG